MSIWDDDNPKYGTYEGPAGNASQWSSAFQSACDQSTTVSHILSVTAYDDLGIQATATDAEVKKAYRLLAKKYHPDHPNNPNADEAKFRKVTTAYQHINAMRNPNLNVQIQPAPRRSNDNEVEPRDDSDLIIPQLLTEIKDEAFLEMLLNDNAFGCQEKMDGRHITLEVKDGQTIRRNKKGVATTDSEFYSSLFVPGVDLLLDGEHIDNLFYVWDVLQIGDLDLRGVDYQTRYDNLMNLHFGSAIRKVQLHTGVNAKRRLFNKLKPIKEGIVFKRLSAPFTPGKGTDQYKYKFYAEASVIVVAGRPGKASIGMEMINNNGNRQFVGYCTCCLHPLPSVDNVAEVKYLYAVEKLVQPSFKMLRDDVDIDECLMTQLKYKHGR